MAPTVKSSNIFCTGYGQNVGYGIDLPKKEPTIPQTPSLDTSVYPNYYQPNFNGYVAPVMQPLYSDPRFGALFMPGMYGRGIPMLHTFDNLVTIENPTDQEASLEFNILKAETPSQPKTVGLPMDDLVTQTPSEDSSESSANVNFNTLVTKSEQKAPTEKFGVQPIPDGTDRSMLPKPPMTLADTAVNAHLNKSNQTQPNQSERKLNNWFTRLLDQRGQDYISSGKLTYEEVSKNAERIIDDLIAGRVDYGKQGQYLINPVVIETLINYCSNKLAIDKAIQFSLGYTYNDYTSHPGDMSQERAMALGVIDDALSRSITQSIAITNQDIGIYEILYKKLMYVNATKNASSLFSLTNDLNNYKKQMKKRY